MALQADVMLSERARKVLAKAASLSPEERAELADELWRSLPEDEAEANGEIARRVEDVLAGRAELVALDDAHAMIRTEATGRR